MEQKLNNTIKEVMKNNYTEQEQEHFTLWLEQQINECEKQEQEEQIKQQKVNV
jgi:hypothetical protein